MWIKFNRTIFVNPRTYSEGEIGEVRDSVAKGLIDSGVAEWAPEPKPKQISTATLKTKTRKATLEKEQS